MALPLSKVTTSKDLIIPKPGKARKKPHGREFNHPGILPMQSVGKRRTGTCLAPDVVQLGAHVKSSGFLKFWVFFAWGNPKQETSWYFVPSPENPSLNKRLGRGTTGMKTTSQVQLGHQCLWQPLV